MPILPLSSPEEPKYVWMLVDNAFLYHSPLGGKHEARFGCEIGFVMKHKGVKMRCLDNVVVVGEDKDICWVFELNESSSITSLSKLRVCE
jgi:hypothetical protein